MGGEDQTRFPPPWLGNPLEGCGDIANHRLDVTGMIVEDSQLVELRSVGAKIALAKIAMAKITLACISGEERELPSSSVRFLPSIEMTAVSVLASFHPTLTSLQTSGESR